MLSKKLYDKNTQEKRLSMEASAYWKRRKEASVQNYRKIASTNYYKLYAADGIKSAAVKKEV